MNSLLRIFRRVVVIEFEHRCLGLMSSVLASSSAKFACCHGLTRVKPLTRIGLLAGLSVAQLLLAQPITPPVVAARPRIILTPTLISDIRAKAAAGDSDWIALKARADAAANEQVQPILRIVSATNAKPTVITVDSAVPTAVGTCVLTVIIGGNNGSWAALSNDPNRVDHRSLKVLSPTTMEVYTGSGPGCVPTDAVDSTSFGPYNGQDAAVFSQQNQLDLPPPRLSKGFWGENTTDSLFLLGVAYYATPNAADRVKYRTAGVAILEYLGILGGQYGIRFNTGSAYPARFYTVFMALGYDWFYADLTPTIRSNVWMSLNYQFDQLTKVSGYCLATPCGPGASSELNVGKGYNNFWLTQIQGIAWSALATYDGADGNPRAAELWGYAKRDIDRHLEGAFRPTPSNEARSWPGDAGFRIGRPPEGGSYGYDTLLVMFMMLGGIESATTDPATHYFSERPWGKFLARTILYQLHPDNFSLNSDGSVFTGSGSIRRLFPLMLSHFLEGTTEGGWMQELYHSIPTSVYHFALSVKEKPEYALLLYRPRSRVNYRSSLPPYWAGVESDVIWRTSWSTNATWTNWAPLMRHFADHQWARWGTVNVYRGADPVLPNMQFWEGSTGVAVAEGPYLISDTPQLANVMCLAPAYTNDNTCGQTLVAGWAPAPPIPFKQAANFSYGSRNLTAGYDLSAAWGRDNSTRFLRYWQRSVATVRSGADESVTFVWDKVRTLDTSRNKRIQWLMNTATSNSLGTISGSVASNTVGGSSMHIKAVYPATLAMTATPIRATGLASGPEMATRIDITDTAQDNGRDLDALQVLYSAPAGVPAPAIETIPSDNEHVAAVVPGSPNVVFVAARSMVPTADYPYTRPAQLGTATFSVTANGPARFLVADLIPGDYQVRQNDGVLTPLATVDTSGTLYFEANSGGSFSVIPASDNIYSVQVTRQSTTAYQVELRVPTSVTPNSVTRVDLLVGPSQDSAVTAHCHLVVMAAGGTPVTTYLRGDGDGWGGRPANAPGWLTNSRCALLTSELTMAVVNGSLRVSVPVYLASAMDGSKQVFSRVYTPNSDSGWQASAAFTASGGAQAPLILGSSVAMNSGADAIVALQVWSRGGPTGATRVEMLLGSNPSAANACQMAYDVASQTGYLRSESGAWQSANSSGVVLSSNSCFSNQLPSIERAGDGTLTVTFSFRPSAALSGNQNVYGKAFNGSTLDSGWQLKGSAMVSAEAQPPTLLSATSSSSGANRTVVIQAWDASGAANLTRFDVAIGTDSNSPCHVVFMPAGWVYLRYEDRTFGRRVAAGTGVLANSACAIVDAVTVSVANGRATATIPIRFASTSERSIFARVYGGAGSTGWVKMADLPSSAGSSSQSPSFVSLASTVGNDDEAVMILRGWDTAGPGAISRFELFVGSSLSDTAACHVGFQIDSSTLSLRSDLGAPLSTAVPNTALSNSQCMVGGPGLTLNIENGVVALSIPLRASAAFAGSRNVYGKVFNRSNLDSGWQLSGAWTLNSGAQPPTILSATPASGSGSNPTFVIQAWDRSGAAALTRFDLAVGTSDDVLSCHVAFFPAGTVFVRDIDGNFQSRAAAGPGVLSGPACALVDAVSIATQGGTATASIPVRFTSSWTGSRNVYIRVYGSAGNTGWRRIGDWSATSVSGGLPTVLSLSPTAGTGGSGEFAVATWDTDLTNISRVEILLGQTETSTAACHAAFQNGQLFLRGDDASWQSQSSAGMGLSNSRCLIADLPTSSVSSGLMTTVFRLRLSSASAGTQSVYVRAFNRAGESTAWRAMGTWTGQVTDQPPLLLSAQPLTGSTTGVTLTSRSWNASGATNLTRVDFFIGATDSGPGCHMVHMIGSNVLYLRTSDGGWMSRPAGASESLSNDRCTVTGAAGATVSNGALSSSVPVRLDGVVVGEQRIYARVYGAALDTGWILTGSLTTP